MRAPVSRHLRFASAAALTTLAVLALPAAAHAYQVQIQITGAGQVTETTPANLVGSSCVSSSTTPTGVTGRTCHAGTTDGNYGFGWDVDYVATPASGYSFVRWQTTPEHSWNPVICDRSNPAATSSTYTGATCKFRTFDNLQTRAVFADTTAPPDPLISNSPAGAVKGPVEFTLARPSDPTFSHFICQVSGPGDYSAQPACGGGSVSINPPASGEYTLNVRAIDHSDNWSGLVQRTFTIDKSPPETTLFGGPAEDSTTSATSAGFTLASNEPGTFRCELDGVDQGTCTSPKQLTGLSDGAHVFRVRAVDAAGNADPSPAVRQWTVDTVAPETALDAATGPAEGSTTDATGATLAFTSSEAGTFRCFLDDEPLGTCTSPTTVSGLGIGPHVFAVQAVDAAGNADSTRAERRWTVQAPAEPPAEQDDPPVVDPPDAGDGGTQAGVCEAAKRKLSKAKAKLRKLRRANAPDRRIASVKRKVKRLAKSKRSACSA